jgi:phytoene dehydrogenase-like protein
LASYDAVVIGAGPNGLVAANRFVDAGWTVLVLEAAPDVGGAVHSAEDVHPGFVHDTFSAFYPLAAASAAIRSFRLEEQGLIWRHAPAVLGHVRGDGSWALLHRDRELTARMFDEQHPGDGESWMELCRLWDRMGEHVVDALLTPFPPVRPGLAMLGRLPSAGGLDLIRTLLTPAADPSLWAFDGDGPRLLLAGNAGHADIPLHAPLSGLMGLLMTMLGQTLGFPVPEGGAGALASALARRFESRGGEIRRATPAQRVVVDGGRAVAVESEDGTRTTVRRAVVAAVVAPILYERLLSRDDLPRRVRRGMKRFQWDPGTVKVDWALSSRVPWKTEPAYAPGTVHVADDLADMTEAIGQVSAGLVPAHPFLLAGQMTTTDPTRSPDGTESLWAYSHVPRETVGDVAEGGISGRWDHDDRERFADRIQARIEARAPGFGDRILARRVLGPHELEARNANLVGGSINGGTSQLHQQLVFRPFPGLGRAETGIGGLYLGSASAHPGGGVHGAPGMNAARAALAHDRLRRVTRRQLAGR